MSFGPEHELHKRRLGRNIGVGLVLAGFIVLVFALTVVKLGNTAAAPNAPVDANVQKAGS